MNLGILFAGQGSQYVGMGKDIYDKYDNFRKVFNVLSSQQREIAFEGPMEKLSDTRNTQPVMVAFAAGITSELRAAGINPKMTAGLSLGEYSALQSAGVFDAETAIRLVSLRANAMSEASENIECKMSAVLGLDRKVLSECCNEAGQKGIVEISNYNCPGQIVIGGQTEAVAEAEKLAMEKGARRCLPLTVSGPFHTSFMKPAGKVLKEIFSKTRFGQIEIPVVFNAIGREKTDNESIEELLVKQVSNSVFFEDSIRYMADAGIDTIIEVGPGKALSGFVRKTCSNIKILNIDTCDDLENVIRIIKEEA